MLATLSDLSRDLIDLVFPGKCAACGVAVDRGHRFCADCDYALILMETREQCLACGAPVAFGGAVCQRCGGRGYRLFDRVVRLAIFDSPVRELVTRFKYYHGWPIGQLFADRAMRVDRVQALLSETDVLVPVPLHPWRQIVRGFNQADVFARRLSEHTHLPIARPAIRTRMTGHQTLIHSRAKRAKNLRQAFALVRPGSIHDKRITLIDDVFTTGSTLKNLAQALQPANPASISVLTIAMADPKGHAFEAV
jgi:ComF family protein